MYRRLTTVDDDCLMLTEGAVAGDTECIIALCTAEEEINLSHLVSYSTRRLVLVPQSLVAGNRSQLQQWR